MNDFKINETDKLKAGFKVPDNYFDNLADRIMLALPLQETKVVPLYRRKPVWFGAAASFAILAGGAFYFLNNKTASAPDAAAIENYLVYNTNISAYDLGQHLDDADFKELEGSMALSDEAIEDYLLNNNISE
ncbi:hypothetical protein ACLI1A_11165 [Flavobacterium sp. RHBU_3]|uniref:hypothetical protein n=1 Tax=Flavobacterium sp. RHBU_3 TaxID=3391184 RepID=UPI0039854FC5